MFIYIYSKNEEVNVMQKVLFEKDNYEQDLALVLLDAIMNKRLINLKTYHSVKNAMKGEADNGCSEIIGTTTGISI